MSRPDPLPLDHVQPAAESADVPDSAHDALLFNELGLGCLGTILGLAVGAVVILLALLLAGCSPVRTVAVPVRDSTATAVRTRTIVVTDTQFVTLPPQTVYRVTPDTTSHIETDYAASDAAIRGGLLHHTLVTRPMPVPVPVQHRETVRDSIVYREREVPVPVPVVVEVEKPLTAWQQAQLWLGRLVLVALLVALSVWLCRKRAWWLRLFRKK